ncbi:MAG: hypothetical protein PHO63_02610 [Bacilli bacterium]|nr:hypothetical protein [Bacilli bacterium]MDD4809393.1 hypothetical protein [Bacilli bacterium]
MKKYKSKVMIISIIQLNDNNYEITYAINNNYYNQNYKGLLLIKYKCDNVSIFNDFNDFGKWLYGGFNDKGNILCLSK